MRTFLDNAYVGRDCGCTPPYQPPTQTYLGPGEYKSACKLGAGTFSNHTRGYVKHPSRGSVNAGTTANAKQTQITPKAKAIGIGAAIVVGILAFL